MEEVTLTNEQKMFLEECEKEFEDRYTEKDSSFMEIKMREPANPPIVDPWYSRSRRMPQEWNRHNQNRRNNHWDRRNNYQWDRRNNERHERYERHAGKHHLYHRQRMY